MSRYTPLFDAIAKLEANHKEPDMVDATGPFPFKQMYRSQAELLEKVKGNESVCISSHTGWGKTPVFLAMTRKSPSLIIEPRKFLQNQCSTSYYHDFILYGRSGYPCPLSIVHDQRYVTASTGTAAAAPCLLKVECDRTTYHETCPDASKACLNDPCDVFPKDAGWLKYPCDECKYITAQKEAQRVLQSGGVVICNFGNFWNLLKPAKTVVIDESDLFFREISAPMKLKYSTPKKNADDTIQTLLNTEVTGLKNAVKGNDAAFSYRMKNLLYSAQFLQANHELCFKYQRKDAIYVEVDPRNVNILSKKIFKDKRLIIVSATPGQFDMPSYSAQIHQRCGIYFAPVGNLTSRSLKQNPYLMSQAARAIVEISTHMDCVYDADRVVVHCGNVGTHATSLYKILGEQDCIIHEKGKLAETIAAYLESGKKYLLVAAAEYGMDASWCKLQFILKFPFPNLDERMNTLKKTMGPEFSGYYTGEARTRVIQMAGRNVRGFDDFGITVCLDSKVLEDYQKNKGMYPEWFRERVDPKVY